MSPLLRRIFVGVIGLLLPCLVLLSACSDDPILGPSDGESEGGGSYSVIERLARPDTAAASDSTEASPVPANPERF